MKNALIFCLIFLISCSGETETKNTETSGNEKAAEAINFNWLQGNWKRLNDEEGKNTFEYWDKKSADEYVGLGYTMSGQDTVFKEYMRIVKLQNIWNLEVVGVHDDPVYFEFTDFDSNKFVCENKHNEFPKKIEYQFENNKIKAIVSGGEMAIDFNFEKATNE